VDINGDGVGDGALRNISAGGTSIYHWRLASDSKVYVQGFQGFGAMTGSGNLVKTGPGFMAGDRPSDGTDAYIPVGYGAFSGAITVQEGGLAIAYAPGALGDTTHGTTIYNGAYLSLWTYDVSYDNGTNVDYSHHNVTYNPEPLTLGGGTNTAPPQFGCYHTDKWGPIGAGANTDVWTGPITLASDAVITVGNGDGIFGGVYSATNWPDDRLRITGVIAGSGKGLIKEAVGTLELAATNTYNGATVVSNGTLLVSGAIGNSAVSVQTGATLAGNGRISGPVTVQAGGTLSPGSSIGRLAISNTLSLASGSATVMEINQATATNDVVAGLTSVTYGGTLTVTNLGGTLAAGNSYKLFAAGSYAGAFDTLNLPALTGNLVWANRLAVDGSIAVVTPVAPGVTGVAMGAGQNFSLTVTGVVGLSYTLLASTNVALPLNSWSVLTNGNLLVNPLLINDTSASNHPQRFYRFSTP
jgi:autotransporter-associated beta strand protein